MTKVVIDNMLEKMNKSVAVYRKELKPGDKPEAVFLTNEKVEAAREYCNLHGLWKG